MSAPLQNIGAIQSRRMHPHAHPICRWHGWHVYLLHTNSLNSAIRRDDDCFHLVRAPVRRPLRAVILRNNGCRRLLTSVLWLAPPRLGLIVGGFHVVANFDVRTTTSPFRSR